MIDQERKFKIEGFTQRDTEIETLKNQVQEEEKISLDLRSKFSDDREKVLNLQKKLQNLQLYLTEMVSKFATQKEFIMQLNQ